MSPAIAWFDRFVCRPGQAPLIEALHRHGQTQTTSLMPLWGAAGHDVLRLDEWSGLQNPRFFREVTLNLASGQRLLDPRPLIRKLLPGLQLTSGHAVFRFDVGDEILLVPALFLISRLFVFSPSAARYLFEPGTIDGFIDPTPIRTTDSICMRLPPAVTTGRCSADMANLLAWMTLNPSVARSWRSIWFAATRGLIDLTLPDVHVKARLGGFMVDEMHFVCWSKGWVPRRALPNTITVKGQRGRQKVFQRSGPSQECVAGIPEL